MRGGGKRPQKGDPGKSLLCNVQGCNSAAPGRNLFCANHWQWLPERLRAALLGASRGTPAAWAAQGEALKWYASPENRERAEPKAAPEARVIYGD